MRRRRLGTQPRGVRGDPPERPRPQPRPQRPPLLILETERLRLRRFRADDAPTLAGWFADAEFMRHLGVPLDPVTVIDRADDHWDEHGFGPLAVEDGQSGSLIGRSGLSYHRMWPGEPEAGWWVDPGWWGRGIATEAGTASVDWGFTSLRLSRLVSLCVEANLASRRVMEKLGFSLVTRLRDPRLDLDLWIHARSAPDSRLT